MIKNFLYLIFLLSMATQNHAQYHDNVWTFGYTCIPGDSSRFGGTNLYFDNGEGPRGEYVCRDIRFQGNHTASISDEDGNLLFMFNGCTLNDANNEIVEGNEQLINIDSSFEETWWCIDGYNNRQNSVFIPDPYDNSNIFLFHGDIIGLDEEPFILSDNFYVSRISKVDDKWSVEKRDIIVPDTVSIAGISAVRHANGQDWWVITKNQNDNIYHTILLDESGPHLLHSQEIGKLEYITSNGNTTKINRQGNLFATFDPFIGLELLSFDRGTGRFKEYHFEPSWINAFSEITADVEFSPSGDYLYIALINELIQLDLTIPKTEILETMKIVGIYDGFLDLFPTNFWLMQNAPDGKIYMATRNGTQYLHVIHAPDEEGEDCDFRQHDLKLPTVNARAMPYFPNYRLGADSTLLTNVEVNHRDGRLILYPNPANNQLVVKSEHVISKVSIYDVNGRAVINSDRLQIEVSGLSDGIYFVRGITRQGLILTEKLVITR